MAMRKRHKAALGAATLACTTALIAHWEGVDLVAKHNSFDPAGVITVCHGYTNLDDPTLKSGQRFTRAQCEELLKKVIPEYAYPISKCLKHFAEYGPHRQASLISFSYNLGPGRVCNTSVGRRLNAGDIPGGCWAMTGYVKAAGRVLPGLVNRRYKDSFWGEYEWCMRND